MTSEDHKRFIGALALLSLLPGLVDLNEQQIELYFRFLKDLAIEDVEKAIYEIIKRKKITTFPLIGEIREKVELDLNSEVDGAAFTAWSKASHLCESSSYPSKDMLIEDTIKMAFGSWKKFGQMDTFDEVRDRQHFIKCYRILVLRSIRTSGSPELGFRKEVAGLLDEENKE